MPKTEVILIHNVTGLGAETDQVRVAAGYARNYLLPQGLAIPVTAANKRHLEALRQRRAEREAKEYNTMSELAHALGKMTLTIKVKMGEDGKMFGSVTAGTIADELKNQFEASVDKRKIHLPHAIKNLGEHEVELRLHSQVHATLKVQIESSTPLPAAAPAAPEAKDGARRSEGGRGGFRKDKQEEAPAKDKGKKDAPAKSKKG